MPRRSTFRAATTVGIDMGKNDGSGLAKENLHVRRWSEQPCVRPISNAVHVAAGHNALRGSGPDQKRCCGPCGLS
jgi:hypothetical protein